MGEDKPEKVFIYKCRLCGNGFKITPNLKSNPKHELRSLCTPNGHGRSLIIHEECPYGLGLADLEGLFFKKEKECEDAKQKSLQREETEV